MQTSLHLQHAIEISAIAHEGQSDRRGKPYFEHCQRVAHAVDDSEQKIVAYLHDILEKAPVWTLDRLKEEGFPPQILKAVEAITRRDGEAEETYLRRVCSNKLALPVKYADLNDNLAGAEMAGEDTGRFQEAIRLLRDLELSAEQSSPD